MLLSANSSPPQIVPQIQTELVFKHLHDVSGLSVLILVSLSYDPGLAAELLTRNVLQVVSRLNFIGIFLAFYNTL